MMISDGSGMQADSIAIRITIPRYPAAEFTSTIADTSTDITCSSIACAVSERKKSAPLAAAAAFEHDDLTARKIFRQLLRHFLGDAEQPLAAVHFLPDVFGADARGDPQHHEIIDEVGALFDHGLAVAVHGVDHDLDGLFGKLLGHLAAARAKQPRRPRGRRIVMAAGVDRLEQPCN